MNFLKSLEDRTVELEEMNNEIDPILPGTKGKVIFVDDIGNIHVNWENGRTLALIYRVDKFKIIN